MATPVLDLPLSHDDEEPNHIIFWLDQGIGLPTEYTHLKKAFGSNTDPRHETFTMLNDKDYDELLDSKEPVTVLFGGVQFLLQAFVDENSCLEAFEVNQNKRIFFITSGSLGQKAVPRIIESYRNVFTDPITNKPYHSVYIFCGIIDNHVDWAMEYYEYIQMFDFDRDLLQRMTHDIADYFFERGRRILEDIEPKDPLKYLYWAKRLYHRFDKLEADIDTDNPRPVRPSKDTRKIIDFIEKVESEKCANKADEDAPTNDGGDDSDTPYGESSDY
ncbi:unnamed protein product [Adineta ricciae]|uniref:Uncharacterized protein n=1 Tax=Adineta ricciae TaxID=249248 RepID=A0A815D258_ADIRI|nr:unnamed protein product [Adineta ricciae]CAF1637085.1 unnamed protein product [Adineta ricciae]